LPLVSLTEDANITRLETPYGIIQRRTKTTVPSEWALLRIKDSNLLFVFEESDRKEVMATDEKTLKILSRVMGEELGSASKLCSLLLPKKPAKVSKPKATKAKKTE